MVHIARNTSATIGGIAGAAIGTKIGILLCTFFGGPITWVVATAAMVGGVVGGYALGTYTERKVENYYDRKNAKELYMSALEHYCVRESESSQEVNRLKKHYLSMYHPDHIQRHSDETDA